MIASRMLASLWRSACPDVIVQRRIHGVLFTVSLRDHGLWIHYGDRADAERIPMPAAGHVWDLGCNIGLYAVQAALAGSKVTAFDISLVNVLCLRQTARLNGLDGAIVVVHSPVTAARCCWSVAKTGHPEERMHPGAKDSMPFSEAARTYGRPTFIKIDIQGAEVELLTSNAFREYVLDNRIGVHLETHGDAERYVWPEFKQIGPIHYLLNEGGARQ